MLLLGAGCAAPPLSSPDAASTMSSVSSSSPSAAAPTTTVPGDPNAPEALHDAEPVPVDQPDALRPHALEILLDNDNRIQGNLGWSPYLSADGSLAILLLDRSSFAAKRALLVLAVRELDHPERDHELVIVDGPDCLVSPDPPPCDRGGAAASTRKVNTFLARHEWVELQEYTPRIPPSDILDCHGLPLAQHFRMEGYEVEFREPHLRIARADGVVVADRGDVTVSMPPAGCPKRVRTYIGTSGIDQQRRGMYLLLHRCNPGGIECKMSDEYLFFRLPDKPK